MNEPLSIKFRLFALAAVLTLFGLVALYVREFSIFSNTIGVQSLIVGSVIVGLLLATGLLYRFRERLSPWERHIPESLMVLIFCTLFMPLFGSLLNRGLGRADYASFEFLSETPYVDSDYGFVKSKKVRPAGYYLSVRDQGRLLQFRYKKQAYFPLTQPGEKVLLPVRKVLFGFKVITLQ